MNICEASRLRIGDTNPLELLSLYDMDAEGQPPITTATVTVTGTNVATGLPIAGVSWPLALTYEAATDRYAVDMPAEAVLVEDAYYNFVFSVVTGNRSSTFTMGSYAEYRGAV